jgi:hypothetical protein
MSLLESTLAELADSFQLPVLAFNADGLISLRLGQQDVFSLERTEDRGAKGGANNSILLSLIRPWPSHLPDGCQRILRLCGQSSIPLRAGLTRDGKLALTSRLSERGFTLQETLRHLSLLRESHDRLRS